MWIRDNIEGLDGISHPYYVRSILDVIESHMHLAEWKEAELLQKELLKFYDCNGRSAVTAHKSNLSVVNRPVRPQYLQDGRDGAKAVRPVLARCGRQVGRHPPSPADIGRLLLIHIL